MLALLAINAQIVTSPQENKKFKVWDKNVIKITSFNFYKVSQNSIILGQILNLISPQNSTRPIVNGTISQLWG